MRKNQKSSRNGVQDFLCPFTDMNITQGSNMGTHLGTMANDVNGAESGVRYAYYAPCDCRLIWRDLSNGQGMWQSLNKVRFSNGNISFATFVTAHDESFDAQIGQIVPQGSQLGNMGAKHNGKTQATGVHCHIEIAQHKYTISNWKQNGYGIYCFPNETDTDDCYFMDDTNIMNGAGGNWKYLKDVPVDERNEKVDQILHIGSKVKFNGVFKVNGTNASSNTFTCFKLTGTPTRDYHNIPATDFDECDLNGNVIGQDQILYVGSYVKNDKIYEVLEIDKRTDSARLNINGKDVWVFCGPLLEV